VEIRWNQHALEDRILDQSTEIIEIVWLQIPSALNRQSVESIYRMAKDKDRVEIFSKDPKTRLNEAREELGRQTAWHLYGSIIFVLLLAVAVSLWQ